VDNALAVKKPLAVSRCLMFRHILEGAPSVCIEDFSLKNIMADGYEPLKKFAEEWNGENLRWEYERIVERILTARNNENKAHVNVTKKLGNQIRKTLTLPSKRFTWLRTTSKATEDDMSPVSAAYTPVALQGSVQFNRILDDNARDLYKPAIEKLFELAPKTMAKKTDRANVQQGFVFDTVYRFLSCFQSPKLLCVGSYEDTASMALIRMGFPVEEIDPMLNYYLQEFHTKPTTVKNSYQIIFSTSVIEHDPDDKTFMKCIAELLAPGGIAILTCDYKDGWLLGQPKPEVDARFYTKKDLTERLLSYVPDCELMDTPDWNCSDPDFEYLGKYKYTFATFTIQKRIPA
jgi:SAM-dependent methyltransferase